MGEQSSSSLIKIHSDHNNHRRQQPQPELNTAEVEIPSHFLCPISLQLMSDPVTLSTGITYDRQSIEKWLSNGNTTCPVTKQSLPTTTADLLQFLIPNHNLRRLIQSWCSLHSLDRIPTPKPPAEDLIHHLLLTKHSSNSRDECLRRLRSIKDGNDDGRYGWSHQRVLESPGSVTFLTGLVISGDREALALLARINLTGQHLKDVLNSKYQLTPPVKPSSSSSSEDRFMETLISNFLPVTNSSHYNKTTTITAASAAAISSLKLLKLLYSVGEPNRLAMAKPQLFIAMNQLLKDSDSQKDIKLILKLLLDLNPWGRNRVKAVESGTVETLINTILLNTTTTGIIKERKRVCELTLAVLDQICGCAEGRAALVGHAAGLAVVSKKILRVSNVANDRGVRILSWVARNFASDRVLVDMLEVGVVSKLCLVLQVDFVCRKTKERAREILKLHSRVWRNSGCIPAHLATAYPA